MFQKFNVHVCARWMSMSSIDVSEYHILHSFARYRSNFPPHEMSIAYLLILSSAKDHLRVCEIAYNVACRRHIDARRQSQHHHAIPLYHALCRDTSGQLHRALCTTCHDGQTALSVCLHHGCPRISDAHTTSPASVSTFRHTRSGFFFVRSHRG